MTRSSDAGVTLLEVLVALSIVGVMATVSVLTLAPRGDGDIRAEADRLATRLALAVDEALSTGAQLRFEHDERAYRFTRYDRNDEVWSDDDTAFLAPRILTEGTVFDGEGAHIIGADAFGNAFDATLSRDGATWHVRFDGLNAVAEEG